MADRITNDRLHAVNHLVKEHPQGVEAEILSGEEEGRLSFAGAMDGLEPAAGDDLVLDIGGGSTEVVLSRDGTLRSHSMQLGCVRVSERELLGDPPSSAEIDAARIERAGGEFRFNCRVENLDLADSTVRGVVTSSGYIASSCVMLAIGHSALVA